MIYVMTLLRVTVHFFQPLETVFEGWQKMHWQPQQGHYFYFIIINNEQIVWGKIIDVVMLYLHL